MATLVTDPNLPDPDGFYERLIAMHQGLSDSESALVNARLVLLLANHVGDAAVGYEGLGTGEPPGVRRGVGLHGDGRHIASGMAFGVAEAHDRFPAQGLFRIAALKLPRAEKKKAHHAEVGVGERCNGCTRRTPCQLLREESFPKGRPLHEAPL